MKRPETKEQKYWNGDKFRHLKFIEEIEQYADDLEQQLKNCNLQNVSFSLPIERFDAEDWLGENKDIWNHPIITDRNGLESYEVADLMAEFANSVISNES